MSVLPFLSSYKTGLLDLPQDNQSGESTAILPYLILGKGTIPLIVVLGSEDGLAMVTDVPGSLARRFHKRTHRYRILVLSRRFPLLPGCSLEEHVADLSWAADQLGWSPAVWEFHSASGPAGQLLAARKPELVKALILSGTLHRTNARTRQVIEHWLELIRQNSWYDFIWSFFAYTYRPQIVRRYRLFKPLFVRMRGAARYPDRIQNLLSELLIVDNRRLLPDIQAPTLVIGGQEDRIIPAEIQREMGDLITNSRIKLFPGFGHGNDQENPAYEGEIDKFIHRNLGV